MIGIIQLPIMIRASLCLLAIFISIGIFTVEGRKSPLDDIELERRLKFINTPPIKSIELDYAIFDCIDIYKQPAFDHHLLKNHKIQLEPPQVPKGVGKETSHRRSGFGALSPGCPDGTVPIRRTTKEDLIREQSVEEYMKMSQFYPKSPDANSNITSFATLSINKKQPLFGAKAYINIQQPQTYPGEASGAQIWLFNARDDGTVMGGISAGWLVDSEIYGDNRTYFTASWKEGDDKSPAGGCFNIRCPGFVQVDQTTPIGYLLEEVSKYGGPLKDMQTGIYWDRDTGNWVLLAGEENTYVGYWPGEILKGSANSLHFGGVVKSIPNQLSPPMGSGISEECYYSYTAFFSNVGYLLDVFQPITPSDADIVKYVNCNIYKLLPSCKPVHDFIYYFMYGGPRGSC